MEFLDLQWNNKRVVKLKEKTYGSLSTLSSSHNYRGKDDNLFLSVQKFWAEITTVIFVRKDDKDITGIWPRPIYNRNNAATMECSSANLDHLADNGCNSGHIDLDPVQRLRNKCPPATFSRASPAVEIASHACHGDSDSAGRQELKRRLLNDKGSGHASCNMPFTSSSRVSFEEVLAKVVAFPPLRAP
jgi:hypothetical protein